MATPKEKRVIDAARALFMGWTRATACQANVDELSAAVVDLDRPDNPPA
jgi:hypothetical protein